MDRARRHFKPAVAALALLVAAQAALADGARLDELFDQLSRADSADAGRRIEAALTDELMRTGSPAFDLLLQRGADALAARDYPAAIEHLTALLDHDPEVAQAFNLRATAYYMTGEIGPALDDLGHAVSLEPRHFRAIQGLAVLLEEMGDAPGALVLWRAALAIAPMDADIGAAVRRLGLALDGTPL
ncbi:MAG: hypothetical protein H3C51_12180 [Rubellimicrobium sp.]|nr:hypothetical protein [Rubellimicrobium sp.]